MAFDRTGCLVSEAHGVFWYKDICFENEADDQKVQQALSEVAAMEFVAPALMTLEALCKFIEPTKRVADQMATMEVGASFQYEGVRVTRWSNLTYNGERIHLQFLSNC